MIETRPFGRTGHMSTVTLFGAAALGHVTQAEADRTLDLLLEYGVNHIDTAASYGEAEAAHRPVDGQHRKDFFLATKTGERSYAKATEEIHRSLDRMRIDSFDLIQLHNLGHPDEWDEAMGPRRRAGGRHRGARAGHRALHRRDGPRPQHRLPSTSAAWSAFDFDSVLLPYNYAMQMNEGYISRLRRAGCAV